LLKPESAGGTPESLDSLQHAVKKNPIMACHLAILSNWAAFCRNKLGASPQLECWNIPSFHAAYQEDGRKKYDDFNKL
jgi:hypothetical protein